MDHSLVRHLMVESQIRPHCVTDERILAAFEDVPREQFVPHDMVDVAYVDEAIVLEPGRFMASPMVFARLMQSADLGASDVVLLLSSANGYAAAVLSRLVATVVALESDLSRATQTTQKLTNIGSDNVVLIDAPLTEGYAKQAPYDVIMFEGAVSEVPSAISDQLSEGGRLLAILKTGVGLGKAVLITRLNDRLSQLELFDINAPYLAGFEPEIGFKFAV